MCGGGWGLFKLLFVLVGFNAPINIENLLVVEKIPLFKVEWGNCFQMLVTIN